VTVVYEAVFPAAVVTAMTALAALVASLTMLTVNPAFESTYDDLAVPSSL